MAGQYSSNKMYTASFRGIEFLIDGVSEQGGQKTAVHEFVNSNRRVVESLGVKLPTFSVEALVHGEDYLERKAAIIRAMQKRGAGQFVHPFDGRKNVYPLDYNVTENETRLGQATISLTFAVVGTADLSGVPTPASINASTLSDNADTVQAAAENEVADKVKTEDKGAFRSALDKMKGWSKSFSDLGRTVTKKINTVTGAVEDITDTVSSYTATVDKFTSDIGRLLSTPAQLASSLTTLMSSVRALFNEPGLMWDAQKSLFGLGEKKTKWPYSNRSTQARAANDDAFNVWIQSSSLAEQVVAMSQFNFVTSLDIGVVSDTLNQNFATVLAKPMSQDLREALETMQANSQLFLNNQLTVTPNTFTITTPPVPLDELLYRFYGNTDNRALVMSLNNIVDTTEVSGEIILVTVNDNTN